MAEYARAMRWDTDGNTERAVCRAIKEVGIMVTRGRVTGSRLRQARRRGTRTKTRVTVSAVATTGFAKTQTLLEHALSPHTRAVDAGDNCCGAELGGASEGVRRSLAVSRV